MAQDHTYTPLNISSRATYMFWTRIAFVRENDPLAFLLQRGPEVPHIRAKHHFAKRLSVTGIDHYLKYASILSNALLISSLGTQNDSRKCLCPVGPKAIPGVVETLPSLKSFLQKVVES